ncbi:MAG: ImmA/IrrE family metallo-endopeptidase [Desulfomonile tiedjei]|nr:ImmA/IrrE family metallo-endopeptidase [Desulfomonile tiedjei]
MPKSVQALIAPELLVWARNRAGFTVEQVAKKLSVRPERLEEWESGAKHPTINQLRQLAQIYKRPLAVFYLSAPPLDFDPLRDYRSIWGRTRETESPELKLEIRRAWSRRDIALDLYQSLEGEPPSFSLEVDASEGPEHLANRIRSILGVTRELQSGFPHDYEAYNWWRSALERLGLLVFQASGVDLSEMRGFSISERPFPVIVVNVKDSPVARIFTMLHELVHIVQLEGGLCDLEESRGHPRTQDGEVFSNRVAGEILVPREDLLKEQIVTRRGFSDFWPNEEIVELAHAFRVSQEVLVRRLLICGLTTDDFYQQKRAEWRQYKRPVSSGGPQPYRKVISTVGTTFVRLVLTNYYQENITARDVSDFLNVRLRHLGRIEREVMGTNVEFEAVA